MVELVDTQRRERCGLVRGGSSPLGRTSSRHLPDPTRRRALTDCSGRRVRRDEVVAWDQAPWAAPRLNCAGGQKVKSSRSDREVLGVRIPLRAPE